MGVLADNLFTRLNHWWKTFLCKLFGHVPALNELNDRVCSRCGTDLTG